VTMRHLFRLLLTTAVFALMGCAETQNGAPHGRYRLQDPPVTDIEFSTGQHVYVPAYSEITGTGRSNFLLAVNLSVRNTDSGHPITLTSVAYYDNDGTRLGEFLSEARVIPAMGSETFVVSQRDRAGGTGANFMVEWRSEESVSEPVIEAVMVGILGSHSVSFRSPGRVVEEF